MRYLFLLLVAASVGGCLRVNRDPVTGRTDVDVESPLQTGEAWEATVKGSGSYAAIGGNARMTAGAGDVTATISLTGATPGYYPWHVHQGTCATGGPVVGDPGAYGLLTVGSDGKSQGTARLTGVKLNEASNYHVNVHLSATQLGTIIACGDLND